MRKMYSKKQIEEIAKSSGTKLYRHFIETTSGTDSIIIISTNSSPYADINNLAKNCKQPTLIMTYDASKDEISGTGLSGREAFMSRLE